MQAYLADQFPELPCLVNTVKELSEYRANNLLHRNTWRALPDIELCGMGFVCTSVTKQSSKSSANRGCVARGEGATGVSFKESAEAIIRRRALLNVLENVGDLDLTYDDEATGLATSDVDYICQTFFVARMCCLVLKHHAMRGGSGARRFRLWLVVLDQVVSEAEREALQSKAELLLGCFNVEPIHADRVLLPSDVRRAVMQDLALDRAPKRWRVCHEWQETHEQFCSKYELSWPVDITNGNGKEFQGFLLREAELAAIAHEFFPQSEPFEWEFFDTNHTMERVMWTEQAEKPRNPWQTLVPTLTCKSVIAARRGETLRKMDPLEMRKTLL